MGTATVPAMDRRVETAALTALVAGALFAGASVYFVRLSELGPIASAFHRAFLALPALYLVMVLENRRQRQNAISQPSRQMSQREWRLLVIAGLFFAGDLFFWHLAIMNTAVANATLLATLSPIYVTVAMFLLWRVRASRAFLVGTALAVIGAAFLIGDSVTFNPGRLWGDVYGVITGLFLAGYMISMGRLRLTTTLGTGAIMFWSSAVTATVLLLAALIMEGDIIPPSAYGLGILVLLALISHVGGQGLISYAMAHLPTAFASLALVLEVLAAALLGWLFLAEPLGPWQWAGAVVVVAGVVVAKRGSRVEPAS